MIFSCPEQLLKCSCRSHLCVHLCEKVIFRVEWVSEWASGRVSEWVNFLHQTPFFLPQNFFAPENFFTRKLFSPDFFLFLHQKPISTRKLFSTRSCFSPENLFTRKKIYQKNVSPEIFFTKDIFSQEIFFTRIYFSPEFFFSLEFLAAQSSSIPLVVGPSV